MHSTLASSWHRCIVLSLLATTMFASVSFAASDPTHTHTSSVASARGGDPTDPTSGPVEHARKAKHEPRPSTTSHVTFKAVKLIPVAIVAQDQTSSDSIATIIQRDLSQNDRIRAVPVISSMGSNAMSYASLRAASAALALRITPGLGSVNVELYDVNTQAVRQSATFPIPVPSAYRDAGQLRDSLARVLAQSAATTRSALARNAFLRDSVYATLYTPRPKFRNRDSEARWIGDSVTRAGQFAALTRAATAFMENTRRDTAAYNAALPMVLAHDTYVRDSLAREVRWAIHGVSDEVNRWITGTRGVSQTRITYVLDGAVHVVDFDGANDHAVTHGGDAMSPAWHPSGHFIVFSDMNDAGTQIGQIDLATGTTHFFNATPRGMNITPVYTHDGKSIVYANNSTGMNADLIMMSATDSTAPLRKIAAFGFDNSAPCLSPDGMRIAFISPRPKTPQIYSVGIDGRGEELETPFTPGVRSYRTSPDWSPDGHTIAYEQQNGDFQVWTVDLANKHMRKLTDVGENEDPTWAPDARHIAVTSTRGGNKTLWILDTESGQYRQLTFAPGARLAAWSPVLVSGI